MKKSFIWFLTAILALGVFLPTASASGTPPKSKKEEVLAKVKEIVKEDTNVEFIDANELPEGTPWLYFDTVEDFEKYVNEHRNNGNNRDKFDPTINGKDDSHPLPSGKPTDVSTMATGLGYIKWYDNNWWELTQMRMTFNYSYYYSGGYKYFSGVSGINSWSANISPVNWNQTNSDYNIVDSKRTLELMLTGYHLFGVNIAGFPIGTKAWDKYTKYFYRSQI